jgi:hypothetical protein
LKTKTDHNFTVENPLELQMLTLYFLIHTVLQPAFRSNSICFCKGNIFHAANLNKWNIQVHYTSFIISDNYSKIKHRVPIDFGVIARILSVKYLRLHIHVFFKEATSFFPFELQPFSHSTFSKKSQAVLMVKCSFLNISSQGPNAPDCVTLAI